jgi:hypothetical protein
MDAWTGGVRDRTVLNFDPVNHRFWRIRHDPAAQTVNFELSADGQTWSVGKTVAATFPLNSMTMTLLAGAWGNGNGAPGAALYDNVRLAYNGTGQGIALLANPNGTQLAEGGPPPEPARGAFKIEELSLYFQHWWKVLRVNV